MMLVLLCCFLPVVAARGTFDWMKEALESDTELSARFNEYLINNGKSYKQNEMKFRLRLFR